MTTPKNYAPDYYEQASEAERKVLNAYDPSKFPVWLLTVDMVVLAVAKDDITVEPLTLLIKRKNHPFKGQWALPGGFINTDENPTEAAIRELQEETGLVVEFAAQVGAFGAVGRDPRGPSVSVAYMTVVAQENGEGPEVKAADDAAEARWFKVTEIPDLGLAFDHARILETVIAPTDPEEQ